MEAPDSWSKGAQVKGGKLHRAVTCTVKETKNISWMNYLQTPVEEKDEADIIKCTMGKLDRDTMEENMRQKMWLLSLTMLQQSYENLFPHI